MMDPATRSANGTRLAPKIAAVMVIKAIGLAMLWLFFVRNHTVNVDAGGTATAFRLTGEGQTTNIKSHGEPALSRRCRGAVASRRRTK